MLGMEGWGDIRDKTMFTQEQLLTLKDHVSLHHVLNRSRKPRDT